MPTKQTRTTLTPEDILAGHSSLVVDLAQQLRAIVRRTVPEATERAYPGWRAIGYRHPEAGYFSAIFPYRDYVALGLEFGAYLPDPAGLLRAGPSDGKRVRYVEVRRRKDIATRAIQCLLLESIAFRSGSGKKPA
jgi:hypothetical protein